LEFETSKTIKVSEAVQHRLMALGKKGETFNAIIERLLTEYEERRKGGTQQ
jgi:predicted CopG family antitoxin